MNKWKCELCGSENKSDLKQLCRHCWTKEWRKKNPTKQASYVKKYVKNNKQKRKAWSEVERGKNQVKIEGLCSICNLHEARIRHHPDYSKPDFVILVCHKCHEKIHNPQERSDVDVQSVVDKPVDAQSEQERGITEISSPLKLTQSPAIRKGCSKKMKEIKGYNRFMNGQKITVKPHAKNLYFKSRQPKGCTGDSCGGRFKCPPCRMKEKQGCGKIMGVEPLDKCELLVCGKNCLCPQCRGGK